ncbi:hypothetical protein Aca07nite_71780 [Actinoplanes capillaceus]|uniref:Uncharacterized protein n=1 Tax=Actinoplanes campanulatus TaxID=113559 RepID=A0ABQ3WUD8_9ACTN|nr:hypothetical protein [Actinoplanes capillaceus]GID49903.1 hypothetical protein Aca07nite_71780 [Actinoplanes capillaceus]
MFAQMTDGDGVQVRRVVHLLVLAAIVLCGLAGPHLADAKLPAGKVAVTAHAHGYADDFASMASPAISSFVDGDFGLLGTPRIDSPADRSAGETCPGYTTGAATQTALTQDSATSRVTADAVAEPARSDGVGTPQGLQSSGLRIADLAVQRI